MDLTTSDFKATEVEGETALLAELDRLRPAEIIYPAGAAQLPALAQNSAAVFNPCEDWVFAPETALFTVREHFKVASLDGFGLRDRTAAVGAAGAVLHYLTQQLRRECLGPDPAFVLSERGFHGAGPGRRCATWRFSSRCAATPRAPPRLYGAVNRTVTPMGARRLRDWLSSPLAAAGPILRRRDAVQLWLENSAALDEFRRELAGVRDLERTLGRLAAGSGNGRDLVSLRQALEKIPALKQLLRQLAAGPARRAAGCLARVADGARRRRRPQTARRR